MADDHILFLSWKRVVPGREGYAGELFQSTLNYFKRQAEQGNVAGVEPCLLSASNSDVNGFIIVRGTAEKLATISQQQDYLNIVIQAGLCLQDFSVVHGYRGAKIAEMMNTWKNYASKF